MGIVIHREKYFYKEIFSIIVRSLGPFSLSSYSSSEDIIMPKTLTLLATGQNLLVMSILVVKLSSGGVGPGGVPGLLT